MKKFNIEIYYFDYKENHGKVVMSSIPIFANDIQDAERTSDLLFPSLGEELFYKEIEEGWPDDIKLQSEELNDQ